MSVARPRGRGAGAHPHVSTPAGSRCTRSPESTRRSPRGTFTAVMGPSGSGKSTLLQTAAGLDRPTSGRVWIGGTRSCPRLVRDQADRAAPDRIGFVFQAFNLIGALTVEENILLPLRLSGARPDRAWLSEVVDRVGVTALRHPAVRAVRRPAAAGRDRPRARRPAGRHLLRRADRRARHADGRRRTSPAAGDRRRPRPDGRHGHPRPGGRLVRRPRAGARRRPDRCRHAAARRRPDRRTAGLARPQAGDGGMTGIALRLLRHRPGSVRRDSDRVDRRCDHPDQYGCVGGVRTASAARAAAIYERRDRCRETRTDHHWQAVGRSLHGNGSTARARVAADWSGDRTAQGARC